jgi:DNA transformation protein
VHRRTVLVLPEYGHELRGVWQGQAYDLAMTVSAVYLQYILEQLAGAGRVTSRRMFGAVGLYCDGLFFGVIDDDTLFLKVDDSTRGDYESRGMKAFRPYADKPEISMSYFTVPADVLDDADELVAWARRSVAVAAHTAKPKSPSRTTRASKPRAKPAPKRGKGGRGGVRKRPR